MDFLSIQGGTVKEGKMAELQQWLAAHEPELRDVCPQGKRVRRHVRDDLPDVRQRPRIFVYHHCSPSNWRKANLRLRLTCAVDCEESHRVGREGDGVFADRSIHHACRGVC